MVIVFPDYYEDTILNLSAGDCFELYGAYYMVTDGAGMDRPISSVVCVDVITGELKVFMQGEKVRKVEFEAHFAED